MPINDNDQPQNGAGNGGANNGGQESGAQFSGMPNFGSLHASTMFSPIGRGIGSEAYTGLKTKLAEIYKETHQGFKVAIIDLDNVKYDDFRYSSLIIALQRKDKEGMKLGASYFLMLLAGTGEEMTPTFEQIGNQQVEVWRVPSEAIDNVLLKAAKDAVNKNFPETANANTYVGGMVVPADFNPEDKQAVHALALNAGLAVGNDVYYRDPNFNDVNLGVMKKDSTLTIDHQFGRTTLMNQVGEPIRSDFRVRLISKKTNGDQKVSVNSGDREKTISNVSGYIDLVYAPDPSRRNVNPFLAAQMNMTNDPTKNQIYSPVMVVTDLENNLAYTPASVLLALATALTMAVNMNWIQVYRPLGNIDKTTVDMNDVGALNIEANVHGEAGGFGTKFDTKAPEVDLPTLGSYIGALVRSGLFAAIDVPDAGPQSWFLSIFVAAMRGSRAAYTALYNAANSLTNGAFARHFQQGEAMFVDMGNRIHLGSWYDRRQQKRDIRDFDNLANMNLQGESNPQAIRDFSDTWHRVDFPLPQRLAARKRQIIALSGETAKVTGMATRVTFSPKFAEALRLGINETEMPVRVTSQMSANDFNNNRGVADWAVNGGMYANSVFQQAAFFNQNNGMYQAGSVGRW